MFKRASIEALFFIMKGKILISSPSLLSDSIFYKSIILLVKKFGILSLGIGVNIGMFILLLFQIKSLYKFNLFKYEFMFPRTSFVLFNKIIILVFFSLFTNIR